MNVQKKDKTWHSTGFPCSSALGKDFPGFRGFTLTELIVTIATVLVLATLGIGGVKNMLSKASATTCLSNLRQMHLDILNYSQNNDNKLPPLEDSTGSGTNYWLDTVTLAVYGDNAKRKHQGCPSARKLLNFRPQDRTYSFNASLVKRSNPRLNGLHSSSKTMLIADGAIPNGKYNYYMFVSSYMPYGIHQGVANILFCDGHVEPRSTNNIPFSNGTRGSDAWLFWYGTEN